MSAQTIMIRIVKHPKWIGGSGAECRWVAEETTTKRRGGSLCCASSAAKQCALNYFFGGSTARFVQGRAERVSLKKAGNDRYKATYHEEAA
ncbi:MAG: hypothetical protein AB1705_15370 [Verrucomicrobiota bacterium]